MDLQDFFREHAISREVAQTRPYIRFEKGDFDTVLRDYDENLVRRLGTASLTLDESKRAARRERRHLRKIVAQSGGLIMRRDNYGGLESRFPWNPTVSAEIRPDEAVALDRPRWHFHGDEYPTSETWPVHPTSGKKLPKSQVHSADRMRDHIAKGSATSDLREKLHFGVNSQEVHEHQDVAKYVFLPGDDHASRVDIHPLALQRLVGLYESIHRVYFVMEGCIKADAVLTAILESGEPASVISVPSVTLWNADEIEHLAMRFLSARTRGFLPEIVIVPDADWYDKEAVLFQALLCRSLWRRLGYEASIAAPPVEGISNGIKGVDDFLAAGGKLEDLIVLDREAPVINDLIALQHMRSDKRLTCYRMLRALAEHANEDGEFRGSLEKLARVCGFSRRTAFRAVNYLLEARLIIADRPAILEKPHWVRGVGEVCKFDWEDQPTFTLPEDLRAEPFRFFPLSKWHLGENMSEIAVTRSLEKITSEGREQAARIEQKLDELTRITLSLAGNPVEEAERLLADSA